MEDAEQLNSFLVDVFGRINKIEERAMAADWAARCPSPKSTSSRRSVTGNLCV